MVTIGTAFTFKANQIIMMGYMVMKLQGTHEDYPSRADHFLSAFEAALCGRAKEVGRKCFMSSRLNRGCPQVGFSAKNFDGHSCN